MTPYNINNKGSKSAKSGRVRERNKPPDIVRNPPKFPILNTVNSYFFLTL